MNIVYSLDGGEDRGEERRGEAGGDDGGVWEESQTR